MAYDNRDKLRAAELLKPENLPPDFLAYVADYVTLNQPPFTSGQLIGAARYSWQVDANGTPQTIVSSAADTSIYSFMVGGGTLGTDGCLRLLIEGDYLNNSGVGATYTITVNYGATTLWKDTSGSLASSANHRPFRMIAELSAADSPSSQVLTGVVYLGGSGGSTTGIGDLATQADRHAFGGVATENSAVNKTLEVKFQHSASSASLSFLRNYALLTKIGH